jgi:hypothetical protein
MSCIATLILPTQDQECSWIPTKGVKLLMVLAKENVHTL